MDKVNFMRKVGLGLAIVCGIGLQAIGQMNGLEMKQFLRMLQAAPTFSSVMDSLSRHDYHPDSVSFPMVREALWQRFLEEQRRFPDRMQQFTAGKCDYAHGKTGQFTLKKKGVRPLHGYPVFIGLHGGGGGPKEMNDEQWEQVQSYYLKSVDSAIYVAPRGPNNTWNLHFDSDAQAFYARLLKDLRLFAGADPNRIYLLGYSAGGDGVYQLAPRLASELAAANMSAGHHNGVRADNLQHLPMLLQVGELDAAYNRNVETVRYAMRLDSLSKRFQGDYVHQVYVHARAEHSYVRDRMGAAYRAPVLADPIGWLQDPKDTSSTQAVTDGPTWLRQFERDPYPRYLRWDLTTTLEGSRNWYWVSSESKPAEKLKEQPIMDLRCDEGSNHISVNGAVVSFSIHLHEKLVNPQRPLTVVVNGKEFTVKIQPSALELAKTIQSHSDPSYGFWQSIRVIIDEKGSIRVD